MEVTTIMAIIAGVLLVVHWKGRNAVWGGATIGAIVGLIIALIKSDWGLMIPSFAIGTFVGTIIEWSWRLAKKMRKSK